MCKKNFYTILTATFFVILSFFQSLLAQDQYLPFMGGQKWECTQGNWNDPQGTSNVSHVNKPEEGKTSMKYAWDFTPGGCLGHPIIAPWEGIAIYVYYNPSDSYNGGWGNTVIIENNTDCIKLHHLEEVFVKVLEKIRAGQVVGLCGDTGFGTGAHIHIQKDDACELNSQSIASSFADVSSNNGIPIQNTYYRSANTFVFDRNQAKRPNAFGTISPVLSDPGNTSGITWYSPFNVNDQQNCYIRRFENVNCGGGMTGRAGIMYDALHGAREAYSLRCEFYDFWTKAGGPKSTLGLPISDEYVLSNGLVTQDFRKGVLIWSGTGTTTQSSWGVSAPGVMADGSFNNQFSYLFIDAFNRNGKRKELGFPYNTVISWPKTNYLYQEFVTNFEEASLLVYDQNNADYALPSGFLFESISGTNFNKDTDVSGNNVYAIKYFWQNLFADVLDDYRLIETLGAPITDEIKTTYEGKTTFLQYFQKGYQVYYDNIGKCFFYFKEDVSGETCSLDTSAPFNSFEELMSAHFGSNNNDPEILPDYHSTSGENLQLQTLELYSTTADYTYFLGDENPLNVLIKVTNIGTADSLQFSYLAMYFSKNLPPKKEDEISGLYIPALKVNTSFSQYLSYQVPNNITAGFYYLSAEADSNFEINELSETNNLVSFTVEVKEQPLSDYSVYGFNLNGKTSGITYEMKNNVGDNLLPFEFYVQNQGSGNAENESTATLYLSKDNSPSYDDFIMLELSLPALKSSISQRFYEIFEVLKKDKVAVGNYYFLLWIDSKNVLPENIESNNFSWIPITLTASPTDYDRDGYFSKETGGNDCDDLSSSIHPGAYDECENGVDEDCNGVDRACPRNTIIVPTHYSTVETAINNAQDHDTILVLPGKYREERWNLYNKSLTIKSDGGAFLTEIDLNDYLDISGSGSSEISGFTFIHLSSDQNKNLLSIDDFASPLISHNIFKNACNNAIVISRNSNPKILNNLIIKTQTGCGIYCLSYSAPLILGNTIDQAGNYGISLNYCGATVQNNIISNSLRGGVEAYFDPLPVLSFNNVWGSKLYDYDTDNRIVILNSISSDPLYVNSMASDYHLTLDSPCVNKGNSNLPVTISTDLDNEARIFGGIIDLGADELLKNPCFDQDQDNFYDSSCGGNDCHDLNFTINPEALEICGNNLDENCDGFDDLCPPQDFDGDNYDDRVDCDDSNSAIYPGALEICGNNIDEDCDEADSICPVIDLDNDKFVSEVDCNDNDSLVHPGALEICGNGIDEDCDGVDLDCLAIDFDGDGYSPKDGDCDDRNFKINPGVAEICDGIDNNCNGEIDEKLDLDQDGICDEVDACLINCVGDINNDCLINAGDLRLIINLILEMKYETKADLNQDNRIDAGDLRLVINLILQRKECE